MVCVLTLQRKVEAFHHESKLQGYTKIEEEYESNANSDANYKEIQETEESQSNTDSDASLVYIFTTYLPSKQK